MNDNEFLDYLDGMVETERCGVVYEHVARLLRLAGADEKAKEFDNIGHGFIQYQHSAVSNAVDMARKRMLEND